ncbi:hypothetical protein EB118_19845 [bacterium]|nr:hypothetical protein [bacterium]NDC95829.1 hypothetical protein [bacterium]NDD83979.1 hypothetical protein [bacterium]NDG32316.1 hypothetical protein [bacterium]
MNICILYGRLHFLWDVLRRISLLHKGLRQAGRAKFDVTPLLPITYDAFAKCNAKCSTVLQIALLPLWHSVFSTGKIDHKIFLDWHGKCIYIWHKKERMKMKMQVIQITQNTSAMVRNGKIIYLIQNGRVHQDPLKIRYFQRMI